MALTGFASPAWAGQNDASIRLPQGHLALAAGRLKGVLPLLHTPAWALHGDLHGDLATQTALLEEATLLPTPPRSSTWVRVPMRTSSHPTAGRKCAGTPGK